MTNPFDFVNDINSNKEDIMNEDNEKDYVPYLVNHQLSYFHDTVALANEMNVNHHIDSKLQFSFLLNTVRKRKRFSKWMKQEVLEDIESVKKYYGYSTDLARQTVHLLSEDQLYIIRKKVNVGGKNG